MVIRKRSEQPRPIHQPNEISPFTRYSEFLGLREKLATAFPQAKTALPVLPPKSIICKYKTHDIDQGAALTSSSSKIDSSRNSWRNAGLVSITS